MPADQHTTLHPTLNMPLLRPDHAARLLSVRTSWIYNAVRCGRPPRCRVGCHIRFTQAMLEDWLDRRKAV